MEVSFHSLDAKVLKVFILYLAPLLLGPSPGKICFVMNVIKSPSDPLNPTINLEQFYVF